MVDEVERCIGSFFLLPVVTCLTASLDKAQSVPGSKKRPGPIQILLAATFSRKMALKCQALIGGDYNDST